MKKTLTKFLALIMLLSGISTSHAAMMLTVSNNGDAGAPLIVKKSTKLPCAPAFQAATKSQLEAKKSCCDAQGACGQDCSTCIMTSGTTAGMVSEFDTKLFIHMSSRYHLSSYLFLSSALTNLYKPPRS